MPPETTNIQVRVVVTTFDKENIEIDEVREYTSVEQLGELARAAVEKAKAAYYA
jgi:hypothetical protein